jgi:putative hydroxymethylpyrimidine transport system substrate-binding protein
MRKIRLALEWFLNPDHVPFVVATRQGWFAELGIEVELVEPQAHVDAVSALRDGAVDAAITEPIHLVQDAADGHDIRGFARFLHTNGGVMYLRSSGIRRPADLAGKRIQYPGAPGPGGLAIVRTMIEADDGEPGELVPVNNGFFHTDALVEGKADAATLAFCNFEVVEARHRGHDAAFFALKDWGIPDFCQLILIALPATLDAREDDLRALIAGLRRGIDATKQDPALCWRLWAEHVGEAAQGELARAIFDATLPCFTHDFDQSEDYYEQLGAWIVASEQHHLAPAPADIWTPRLLR